ncbi:MAG: PQQ-binding-like beta-propeller repeat protein [Candidatus Nealsonbacteria bacterium]|nr:PQQ-binding-like beta-propeller repeat protein [Candidatus Nealsonbacteria bacterium]
MKNLLRSALLSIAIVLPSSSICLAESAEHLLQAAGVSGGLIVHLGCGDGKLTADLRAGDACLVQGLDSDPRRIEQARAHIRSIGLQGTVSVVAFDGRRMPYIDNLVNLVVADELGLVSMDEVLRVLAPRGVAMIGGKKTVNPWPGNIDHWQQYLHGADNNAVARDSVVGPPRHLQWCGDPAWSRSHMSMATVVSMVSSNGRLLTIEDTATAENPLLPGRFALVARDAFNGVALWKHDFPDWEPVTRYIKDMAVQLQRRLAAIGETVYCTAGLGAPVTAFDAATGRVLRVYQRTQSTQELAYDRGVLFLVIGDRMNAARYDIVKTQSGKGISLGGSDGEAPFAGAGFRGEYSPQSADKPNPTCAIVAVDANTAEQLWKTGPIEAYVGSTLAIRGKYVVYQTSRGMVCLDSKTGATIWNVEKSISSGDGTQPNTLILTDDSVYAHEGRALCAYSLADGRQKWSGPIWANYEKSADLFFVDGAIWIGGSQQPTRLDAETGKPVVSFKQKMTGPMGHDRCYRNFITEQYYINSKTGGADFIKLDTGREFPNHWVRGTCGLGVIPCNGLLYAPPYSCQCSLGSMLQGLNALYGEPGLKTPGQAIEVERTVRLVNGPGLDRVGKAERSAADPDDWPTYRHDMTRGAATASPVAAKLSTLWKVKLTTVGSAPVVAGGKVFVADVDAHTLHALDVSTGRTLWEFVAGARIDSPPTYHKGQVLFGSADGWVYCLRAADGLLAWKFKDLPERMLCARGQVESVWPITGSLLVRDDIVYVCAGRSSLLDGGMFLYAIDPRTGKVIHSRRIYGPLDQPSGFPATNSRADGAPGDAFKRDVMVADDDLVYIRHKAFNADLTTSDKARPHVLPSAGFLDATPQHRTYWTLDTTYGWTSIGGIDCDILAVDATRYFGVRGFPTHRHSYFDPRLHGGYKLLAGSTAAAARSRTTKRKTPKQPANDDAAQATGFSTHIPLTGRAVVLAADVVFIAGTPAYFRDDPSAKKYEAAYAGKLGGLLWAASASDGKQLASYPLDAPPRWDGMAAAGGRLFISLADGQVICMGR